jgi:SAM-dependent methyltransferase
MAEIDNSHSAPTDQCPVCSSGDIQLLRFGHRGSIVSSNWVIQPNAELRPCCCRACGLVYESRGVRFSLREFYEKVFRPTPLMEFYGDGRGQLVDLLRELTTIEPAGRLLEIGSGRGQFLKRFHDLYSDWQLTAIEPSISFEVLTKTVPAAQAYQCGFQAFECEPKSQDIVVALSVIQSVDDPLALLKWSARALKTGGICFLEASNFETHPNSLVCGDHLSKLTPASLENLAARAGFTMEAIRRAGVPMYCILRAAGDSDETPPSAFLPNINLAQQNERIIDSILQSIINARAAARERNESFGIFGLATAGLTAPFILNFPPSDITAFIDDNSRVWETEVIGRPVISRDQIQSAAIKHIALSLSPVYVEQVAGRLRSAGVTVYGAAGGDTT